MEVRKLWASLVMTAFTLIALCAALTVSTYAWFTFDPYTNVTPMEGNISDGDTNLLISQSKDGPFDKKCGLDPTDMPELLYPVSSADLEAFFASKAQKDGISTHFSDVSDKPEEWLIHGTLYLECLGSGCDVYFNKETMNLGEDIQVLAAGRLGLKITGQDEQTTTLIFKLDDLGDTAGAESKRTVDAEGEVVVASINDGSTPNFKEDPAESIDSYTLTAADPKKLCTLKTDEVAKVEYWLYMEGCDDHCSNPVSSRDVTLQLGFRGEKVEE